uniref:Major facilitator superfamily (MFS) profile domain-containing protein n=1 Tax=Meloidogyne incognita TaxID=6306 RepID=A0A914LBB1_MELIC
MEGRWTCHLVGAVLSASIGSFEFGYNIGCINMPADLIKEWFAVSYNKGLAIHQKRATVDDMKTAWSIAVSIFAIGGIAGGLSCGYFADKLGRKTALLMNNVVALVATGFFVFAKLFDVRYLFTAGRLIIGVNAGLNSGLVPMYLTEISPANLRGTIGSFAQLFVTISILASQVVGLPFILGTADRWPWIFYAICVPAILQLSTLMLCPESPKYTIKVGDNHFQAQQDLIKLRGHTNVQDELAVIADEAKAAKTEEINCADLFGPYLIWPLALSTFLMFAQQLSGINAVMFYSTDIFKSAGLQDQWPNYATLAMGAINVLMTIASVYFVDKQGRRTLLLGSFIGMFVTTAIIAISILSAKHVAFLHWFAYVSVIAVLAFVISFAAGAGSIPWFFVSEVFPLNARGKANSVAVFTNWFCTFAGLMHEFSFLVFTGLVGLFSLFIWKYVPETKNKTLMEVYVEMDRRRGIQRAWHNKMPEEPEKTKATLANTKTKGTTAKDKKILYDNL